MKKLGYMLKNIMLLKFVSPKYIGLSLILFITFFTSISLSLHTIINKNTLSYDYTLKIAPELIIPKNQKGYGNNNFQLAQPDDVEILKNGSFLVTDCNNNRLQHFNKEGILINSLKPENFKLTGKVTPTGIASDNEGYIYLTLEDAGVIVRLKPDLTFDQFIGRSCAISASEYYKSENNGCLFKPQGIIATANGDVFVIDMEKVKFRKNNIRRFGFRKFKKIKNKDKITYKYDIEFALTQEITKIMHKSEGMAISESMNMLFVSEEKPSKNEFENKNKFRFVAAFDLKTGVYLNKMYGVTIKENKILAGYIKKSIDRLLQNSILKSYKTTNNYYL